MSEQRHPDEVPAFGLKHRLALALEVASLKPEDMATEIGRSVTTIRNYLSGRTTPTRAVITAWALRCSVSRIWIETGEIASPDAPPGQEITRRACNGNVVPFGPRGVAPLAVAA